MPEVTENYIRIPNPKHKCDSKNLRTIDISKKKGIKALYCLDHKKIKTYLFDREKWTMEEAKKWVEENAKQSKAIFTTAFVKDLSEEDNGRLGLCVISSGTIDRDGDILEPTGAIFDNFSKNPRLLWSHNAGGGEMRPSIGRVENFEVKDNKIYFQPVFDLKDKFAAEIYRKYKEGFLDAFSVGFLPLEWEETETGYHFKKWEALEFSAVNVPANPEALVVLRDQGFQVSKNFKEWKKDESWKESFGGVQRKMISLFKNIDKEEYQEVANEYKRFGRIPPEVKHFEVALAKVARGKEIKKEMTQKELLEKLLKIATNGIKS